MYICQPIYLILSFGLKEIDSTNLSFTLGFQSHRGFRVTVPVALSLVDKPVVNLFQLQACFLHKFRLIVLLQYIYTKSYFFFHIELVK